MRPSRTRLSRRELTLVAAALLLPVPLFAISGLSAPLPGAIERGLGSVVSPEATAEPSGIEATGRRASGNGSERLSEHGTLRIRRGAGLATIPRTATTRAGGGDVAVGSAGPADGGERAGQPESDEPEGGGDGGAGSPGEPGLPHRPTSPGSPSSNASGGSTAGSTGDAGVSVTLGGQGTANSVTAGTGGVSLDSSTDTGGTGSDEPGGVGVDVTNGGGSRTDIGTSVPGPGASLS